MSSKPRILASLLLLVACSGSSGSIDVLSRRDEGPPTKFVTTASDSGEPTKVTLQEDASDADSGILEFPLIDDGGVDSGAPADVEAPTPRYGVTFNGDPGSGVAVQLPLSVGGQASLTLETWYRLNAASDRGAIMTTPYAYCAVTTGGPATIHCCAHEGNGQGCVVSPTPASQGVWYHVAWVLASGIWTLFVNGSKVGDVPSPFQSYPNIVSSTWPTLDSHLFLGSNGLNGEHAAVCTVDEFRLTYSALYTANFTPPKHFDVVGAMNLLLDEGSGTTSGPATLYGVAVWSAVAR